jgi:DNA repair protein RecO
MHSIHTVEGIVLSKRGVGEANSAVALLTREFGLLRASARSARLERSKLRYGLEPFSFGSYSLVRGAYDWKLTGVQDVEHLAHGASLAKRRAAGRVARLLLRLIQGEDTVAEVYATVEVGLRALFAAQESDIEQVEWLLVLRVLSCLGYVEEKGDVRMFVSSMDFSPEVIMRARAARPVLIRAINESLAATGL